MEHQQTNRMTLPLLAVLLALGMGGVPVVNALLTSYSDASRLGSWLQVFTDMPSIALWDISRIR